MPISAYKPRYATIPLGRNNDFVVRAITFPDLALMATNNMQSMIAIVAKYQEARQDVYSTKNIGEMALTIARDFPTFATEIISSCLVGETVDDKLRETIALLPAPVQMAALIEIAKMTVEEGGGLGNLVADFRAKIEAVAAAANPETLGHPSE